MKSLNEIKKINESIKIYWESESEFNSFKRDLKAAKGKIKSEQSGPQRYGVEIEESELKKIYNNFIKGLNNDYEDVTIEE